MDLVEQLAGTTGDSDRRNELYRRLKSELTAHAAAEERYFYVPLMEHDQTQWQSRHSVAEHQELDELVERLDGYDMSGPQWIPTVEELKERLLHHLAEEEREVFPVAGRVLTEPEKTGLAEAYVGDMERRRAR